MSHNNSEINGGSEEKTFIEKEEDYSPVDMKEDTEDKTFIEKEEENNEDLTLIDSDDEKTLSEEEFSEDHTLIESGFTEREEEEACTLAEEKEILTPLSGREWSKGKVIEDLYRVENIAKGGMGIIYFVDHLRWGIKLVVKSPLEEFLTSEHKNRFIREAETWVDLGKHPNIATAYYVKEIEGIPRIFIEYADGGSLSDWLKKEKLHELADVLDKAIQFSQGMIHAHSKGLVHRDIKPDNVLLMKDGTIKITDFGLVKTKKKLESEVPVEKIERPSGIGSKEWQTMTLAGAMGTPPYMPPEQWTEAEKADKRADIYSFGVMLYEMVCGRRPFIKDPDNPQPAALAYQIMHRFTPPPDPEEFRDGIPEKLKTLLLKCLAKKPEERYNSFEEIMKILPILYSEVSGRDYEKTLPGEAELRSEDLNNRALSYLDLGKRDEAKKSLEEAVRLDPLSISANINLILLNLEGKYESYEDMSLRFKSVRESNSGNAFIYYYEAIFELCHGNPRKALSLASKTIEIDSSNGSFWNLKGVILSNLSDFSEAFIAFEQAVRLEKNPHYLKNYAASLYYTGKYTKSLSEFSKLVNMYPQDSELKTDLAIAFTGTGKHDKAIEIFRKLLNTRPDSIKINLLAGEMLSGINNCVPTFNYRPSKENIKEARRYLEKACAGAPYFARARESLEENACKYGSSSMSPLTATPVNEINIKEEARELISIEAGEIKNLAGHGGKINGVSFFPSGKKGVSCSNESLIELWDLKGGTSINRIHDDKSYMKFEAFHVCVSPDEKHIISSHGDDTVKMWDLSTGKCIRTFFGHTNTVRSLDISPDGRLIVSAGADGRIIVWNKDTGENIDTIERDMGIIYCVKFSPCGNFIVAGTHKKGIWVMDLKKGKAEKQLYGHDGPVICISFSPDGKYLLSGGEDRLLKLWDIEKGSCMKVFTGHSSRIETLDFSPHAFYAVSGDSEGKMKLWDIPGGYCIRTILEHTSVVRSVKFSSDGRYILSGSTDKTLRYIHVPLRGDKVFSSVYKKDYLIVKPRTVQESMEDVELFEKLLSEGEACLKRGRYEEACKLFRQSLEIQGFAKDSRALDGIHRAGRGGLREGIRNIWQLKLFSGESEEIECVDYLAISSLVAYGGKNGIINLKKLKNDEFHKTLSGHSGGILSISISDDGNRLISVDEDSNIKLWDTDSGNCIKTFSEHAGCRVTALFPKARYIATAGGAIDSSIKIWNTINGELLRTFQGHTSEIKSIALSDDGKTLLSGSNDKTLKLWEIESGRCMRNFSGHILPVTACDISGDGSFALSGSQDKTVRLWDRSSEKCLAILKDHKGEITSLAFSPCANFIVSGGTDNTVRLWKRSNGECLRIMEGHTGRVTDVKFSSDGRYILSAGRDGTVRVWEIDWTWNFPEDPTCFRPEETVQMPPEMVIESKEEVVTDSVHFIEEAKEVKKFKNWFLIPLALLAIFIVFRIPSWIYETQKGSTRQLLKILYSQYFDPVPDKWEMNADTLMGKGITGIDVLLEEGLKHKDGAYKLMCLKLLERFADKNEKQREYIRTGGNRSLIELLDNPIPAVRGKAAFLLGKLDCRESLPELKTALTKEKTIWSDTAKQVIDAHKISNRYNGTYYACADCHGQNDTAFDMICAEARMTPWDYTIRTMEKAIEVLEK